MAIVVSSAWVGASSRSTALVAASMRRISPSVAAQTVVPSVVKAIWPIDVVASITAAGSTVVMAGTTPGIAGDAAMDGAADEGIGAITEVAGDPAPDDAHPASRSTIRSGTHAP